MKKPVSKIVILEVETTFTNKDMRTMKFWNDRISDVDITVKQVQVNAVKDDKSGW